MSPNTDRNAARLLADAGWDQALHGLLAGVVHDVNGRITSIGAMEQLAALEEDLGEAFQTEIERLGGVSERVGWLLGDPDAEATPLFPADVMDRAARLHGSAKELSGSDVRVSVPDPAAIPPVMIEVEATAVSRIGCVTANVGKKIKLAPNPNNNTPPNRMLCS